MIFSNSVKGAKVLYQRVESPVFAISLCFKCGSRDEDEGEYGLTHFFEHMVFKGTVKRSAEEISSEIESLGGELDAYTTRDSICFTCKIPNMHYSRAIDIVFDIVLNPLFREEDIVLEKGVVREELRMSKENHEDSGDELFISLIYPEKELGHPILGYEETIDSFSKKHLEDYRASRIIGSNLIVSGAGSTDETAFFKEVERYCEGIGEYGCLPSTDKQKFRAFDKKVKREGMDGVNLYLAFETFPPDHQDRFVLSILNCILGYGMSSRLFVKVRERLGLAYSVSSFPVFHRNEGMLYIYASTSKGQEDRLREVVLKECFELAESITEDEFLKGKNQVIGNLSLGLETVLSKAMFNTRNYSIYGKVVDFSEVIKKVESIEFGDVKTLAKRIFGKENAALMLYGNV